MVKKFNEIKSIIFDMDGVLIDAKEWHYEALNKALEFFGHTSIERNDHLENYDGLPTKIKLNKHPETKKLSLENQKKINTKKQEITAQLINEKCKSYDLHQETLCKLKKEGYKMAVCSNSIKSSIYNMLQQADIHKYIEFFLSNEDVERAKPHPDIYLKAMRKLNLKPDEVLVCEDNIRGLTAAKQSGSYILEIGTVDDVNYKNIKAAINKLENTEFPEQMSRPSIRYTKLSEMPGGWFIGKFFPNIIQTENFEVAVKFYKTGDKEDWHVHKIGTEITLILDGKAKMNNKILKDGDIILIEPGNGTSFEALTDLKTVVIKTPSVPGDKYNK